MILHTHTVMAFILALTAAGMFIHLFRLKQPVNAKGWLMGFYLSLFCWQVENIFRYSLPPEYESSLIFKIQVTAILIPALSSTLIFHTQYVYRFLVDPFQKERNLVLKISIGLFLLEFAFVFWNEFFYTGGIQVTRLSAFILSSVFSLWMISVALRKAFHVRGVDRQVSNAHFIYAGINGCYVIGSTISVMFGFLTVAGSWSYFMFVWLGNLASIVLYITTAAVPASFQTKITGFTYVVAASMLCIITLSFYPPDYSADLSAQMAQQTGLKRLMVITFSVALLIVILMPLMLKISLTRPLQRLLEGVQSVNEGKLDTQVQVGLMDEIGLLTLNFNRMTQNLKKAREELTEYAHTLEIKVATRTTQLQKSFNELKATQAQLIQSEKMASLGELTAGIAHEIKNPLNFITNFSEIGEELTIELKEDMANNVVDKENLDSLIDDIAGNFKKINQHGKRASNIVNSMLVHSRTSKGVKELTDINKLVDIYLHTSIEEMRIKNKSFRVAIEKHLDPSVDKLNIIPEEIGRVLLNLFSNAFYSVQEKKKLLNGAYEPKLQVTTRQINGKIKIGVKDNGIGIPQQVLDKIYQPFFTTKPAGQGTGLGLSLSYDIITKGHGGELKVETKEGEGAEFIIQLPLS